MKEDLADIESLLACARAAVLAGGAVIREGFGTRCEARFKSEHDVGVETDILADHAMKEVIRSAFPDHGIFSEESDPIGRDAPYRWILDPLDGTNNFFAGIPYFASALTLMREGSLVLSAVFQPITGQLYHAVRGGGAFLNGNRFTCKAGVHWRRGTACFIRAHHVNSTEAIRTEADRVLRTIQNSVRRVISMWAPTVDWCLAATGHIELLVSFESEEEDLLPGLLIASEAKASVMRLDGNPFELGDRQVLCCSPAVKDEVLASFNK